MADRVWEELARTLRTSAPYGAVRERLEAAAGSVDVVRLPVPAAAWIAGLVAEDLDLPSLVLVPTETDALAWLEAAALFGDDDSGDAVDFPAPSLTPYQATDVSLLVRARESVALDRILRGVARTVVATPRALFRRLPDPAAFVEGVRTLEPDDEVDLEGLAAHLIRWGYQRTDLVSEVGDFAIRGGIFDLFPPGHDDPVRLDFFGDTLESVRRFDAVSQRSEERLDAVRVLPLSLFPSGGAAADELADALEAELAGDGDGGIGAELEEILASLRDRGEFPGWESWLPWLAGAEAALPDLLPGALVVAVDPPGLAREAEHHAEALASDYAARRARRRPALPPDALEHPGEHVEAALGAARLRVRDLVLAEGRPGDGEDEAVDFAATTTDLFHGQLPRFPQEVAAVREHGDRPLVVVPAGHRRRLEELLEPRGLVGPERAPGTGVELVEGELSRGFRLPAAAVALWSERQLLPRARPQRRPSRKKPRYGPFLSSLRDLKVGDYVVHTDHGIGQFQGLRTLTPEGAGGDGAPSLPPALAERFGKSDGDHTEVMEITYASGKRLLLPLSRLDRVQKYSGIEGVAPRLDKLGGTSWNRTKAKVKKSLRDMADGLLKLYAERKLAEAPALPPDSDWVRQFEAAFVYEETPDQLDAIRAIKEDLEKTRPMDRLLCGDVGYGKTEVAMRAAFKAVDAGYQVAVLAPTTILADQHLETFRERFDGFPVEIDMVSRFRSNAEVKEVKKKLAEGRIDILIGTHRLLSARERFAKLGLLIIDEEQRFGVAQKEQLKKVKKNVHVLAMSATPVPRTLQLSLAGVRDLSVIETPPKDRMAVETAILPFDPQLIREAVEYEIERGGQVYYVYNRVETIEKMLVYLRETVPRARITVGHGQLDEKELYRRMHAFSGGDYDVLLATTIIENGIDIPNVNTMFVHQAERFGLAQLYQLRGRVGRSDQLAFCYLLVPSDRVLSQPARQRLAAIREFTELGAGFRIAARDLEIRGAGNLLGAEQSGHIAAVGIETYLKMLEETVRELKGEEVPEAPSATLDLPLALSIPESYVEDANLRMEIYQKIAAGDEEEGELLGELTDRFGEPPAPVRTLMEAAALKRTAEELRVQAISGRGKTLTLRLRRDARVDVDRLIEMVSTRDGASFSPTGVLTFETPGGGEEMLSVAREILAGLAREGLEA